MICKDYETLLHIENLFETYFQPESYAMVAEEKAVYSITKKKEKSEEKSVKLSPLHLDMIKIGEEDIKNGRFYTEEEMEKTDEEWMNEK